MKKNVANPISLKQEDEASYTEDENRYFEALDIDNHYFHPAEKDNDYFGNGQMLDCQTFSQRNNSKQDLKNVKSEDATKPSLNSNNKEILSNHAKKMEVTILEDNAEAGTSLRDIPNQNIDIKNDYYCPICADKYGDSRLMLQCSICLLWYHCICVDFNRHLAVSVTSQAQYNCISCMDEYYAGFLNYIERNIQHIAVGDINVISHLHTQYLRDASSVSYKRKNESTTGISDATTVQVLPSLRGIQNDRSNCWANAILQAICATPFAGILQEGVTEPSNLLMVII